MWGKRLMQETEPRAISIGVIATACGAGLHVRHARLVSAAAPKP